MLLRKTLLMPVTCPQCGADLFERNAGLKSLTRAYRAGPPRPFDHPPTFYVSQEDELSLMDVRALEVGETLHRQIITEGVRATFPTLFGLAVVWDAPKTEVR